MDERGSLASCDAVGAAFSAGAESARMPLGIKSTTIFRQLILELVWGTIQVAPGFVICFPLPHSAHLICENIE